MQINTLSHPSSTIAELLFNTGETITAELGSMIAMSPQIVVSTTTQTQKKKRYRLKALHRRFAGENLFLNHYTAQSDSQKLLLAPHLPGDILVKTLNDQSLVVQNSSWLASTENVQLDTSWLGLSKAVFSGESGIWIKLSGTGTAILNSFGGIYETNVEDSYIVKVGHIVAFEESLNFTITKANDSWLSSLVGGEGLICKFTGKGKVYSQTHNRDAFGNLLAPLLKRKRNS